MAKSSCIIQLTNGIIRLVGSDEIYFGPQTKLFHFTVSHCLCSYIKILKLPSTLRKEILTLKKFDKFDESV